MKEFYDFPPPLKAGLGQQAKLFRFMTLLLSSLLEPVAFYFFNFSFSSARHKFKIPSPPGIIQLSPRFALSR